MRWDGGRGDLLKGSEVGVVTGEINKSHEKSKGKKTDHK